MLVHWAFVLKKEEEEKKGSITLSKELSIIIIISRDSLGHKDPVL